MAKKTGLGKGLDALFGADNIEENIEELIKNKEVTVKNLKLIEVEPNKEQARKTFDKESLEELAESIKQYGVIQPIIVTRKDGYYQIIAGERRWRASKIAGLKEIPAIIREDEEQKNKEISLIENIQREDLNPIEKARGIKQLMEEYDLTQQKVSEIIGVSRSAIANTLRILNIDPRVLKLAEEGKLSETHCRMLLQETDPDKQYDMALRTINEGKSVEKMTKAIKRGKKISADEQKRLDAVCKEIEDCFKGFFGSKVTIDPGKRRGKIIIEYTSNEDLERMIQLLK